MRNLVLLAAVVCAALCVRHDAPTFPQLDSYEVIAPASEKYNCIAWSVGVTDQWLWPDDGSLEAADRLNGRFGYHRLATLDYSPGDKILVYGVNGVVRHQCRMVNGEWTSKIGQDVVIRYREAGALSGPDYGSPMAVYAHEKSR